jgi:hypothetical protein
LQAFNKAMVNTETWYIVKHNHGHCEILSSEQVEAENSNLDIAEKWGPFASQDEAIARRVGLIRAGKCQPA